MRFSRRIGAAFLLLGAGLVASATETPARRFLFGPGPAVDGWMRVRADTVYTPERGYGFESGDGLTEFLGEATDPAVPGGVTAAQPFFFTATVPQEGNYRITATIGNQNTATDTTIKAELRRLMVEKIQTAPGQFATVSFIVNTRTPRIAATGDIPAGVVKLKAPRETTQEAWAWDHALTLEFNGPAPAVCKIMIEPVDVPTVFLLGDSTVCDQSREPFASWGQMLPRFFRPELAVANHAESGETYRDSLGRRRLDKILSVMRPGDWLIMQFGHNDQKQIAAGTGGPFTTYKDEIKRHVDACRAHGGIPVIVSPMERRNFDDQGKIKPTLADYAEASRQAAQELKVAFIDLNALSIPFYEALGPEKSARAFAAPGGKVDNTHHNNYGSYELAQCIVQGIRDNRLPLAKFIVYDFKGFDPARPDAVETFALPASPQFTNQRPLGD